MDIDVIYKAKDGTRFHDPYECERYENRLGTMPGTVARARVRLKEMGENTYVSGILKVRHEGITSYSNYVVYCVDNKLEDYVNVSELDVDKRWIRSTIGDVLFNLEQYNDDDLCEYEFLYSEHWDFSKHPFGCTRSSNPKLWEEMEKDDQAAAAKEKK